MVRMVALSLELPNGIMPLKWAMPLFLSLAPEWSPCCGVELSPEFLHGFAGFDDDLFLSYQFPIYISCQVIDWAWDN